MLTGLVGLFLVRLSLIRGVNLYRQALWAAILLFLFLAFLTILSFFQEIVNEAAVDNDDCDIIIIIQTSVTEVAERMMSIQPLNVALSHILHRHTHAYFSMYHYKNDV